METGLRVVNPSFRNEPLEAGTADEASRQRQGQVTGKEPTAAMVFEPAAVAGVEGLQRKEKPDVPFV